MTLGTASLQGRRVLVTGGTGFVGAATARCLAAAGAAVASLARRPPAGAAPPGVQALCGDILDDAALARALAEARPDTLLHLAGSVAPPGDFAARRATLERDVLGTETVLAAAASAGVGAAIVLGSAAQYGPQPGGGAVAEDAPCRPAGLYGIAKAAAGAAALDFGRAFGLPVALAIPFNIIGPDQPDHLVPATFIRQVVALPPGAPRRIAVGDTAAERDWIDVRDVAAALALLVHRPRAGAFNICTGRPVAVATLLATIARLVPEPFAWTTEAARLRPGQPSKLHGDPAKLAAETGWRATVPLEESLAAMIRAAGGRLKEMERERA
jgi:GDP-4-dehydro-6-deoxy-D-mannose reductase